MYAYELTKLFEEQVLCKHYDMWRFEASALDIVAIRKTRFDVCVCGFEVKSNRDNALRILDQLPRYVVLLDRVFLVLDSGVRVPPLPTWCGVYRLQNGHFKLVYSPDFSDDLRSRRSVWIDPAAASSPPGLDSDAFIGVLRKWFINRTFGERVQTLTQQEQRILELIGQVQKESLDLWK